jgi:hypothetical protein
MVYLQFVCNLSAMGVDRENFNSYNIVYKDGGLWEKDGSPNMTFQIA